MTDTAQITYEHASGSSLSFFTNDLRITWARLGLRIDYRPDGEILVTDPDVPQRTFTCSSVVSASDVNTMNGWMTGSITYSGSYPRLSVVYLSGSTTLTNIEVAITAVSARLVGADRWRMQITFTEKTT